jgi:tRNA 2-thiouridine synthesizing protein C
MSNQVVVLMRQAPYGSVYTAEGFRTLMGVAVFEMDIQVIFMDDGVYALKKNQRPAKLDMKPLGEGFVQLSEFETVKVYVHDVSLAERGLMPDDLVMAAEIVDSAQVAQILDAAGAVLPF